MKRITIGRNPNSDIYYDMNMVSRSHALLNVYPSGKCEIINMGPNGTTVNGIHIVSNRPYPLKRGDAVVFAGQCALDWSQVPNPTKKWRIIAIAGGSAVVLSILAAVIVWIATSNFGGCSDSSEPGDNNGTSALTSPTDSVSAKDSLTVTEPEVPVDINKVFFPKKKNKDDKKKKDVKKEKDAVPDNQTKKNSPQEKGTSQENQDADNGWHR